MRELLRVLYRLTGNPGARYDLHEQQVYVVDIQEGGQAVEIISKVLRTGMEQAEAAAALVEAQQRPMW